MNYQLINKRKSNTLLGFPALVCVLVCMQSCVEPFDPITQDFERGVVIEVILTNEVKQQEVLLSKVYSFEKDSVTTINNANVMVIDDFQNEYEFQEVEDGRYVSNLEFAAESGVGYNLVIKTQGGITYRSTTEKFEEIAEVENVFAERGPNAFGTDGILIYVDGVDKTGQAQYFRYTYEETYKIVAPKYLNLDFKLENYDPCEPPETYIFEVVPREEQEQICYGYTKSKEIVQTSTVGSINRVEKLPVRFIPSSDFILSHRYSILVKQYVQSEDAYTYYRTLNDFSSSESVFTDIQPGLLKGNMASDNNEADEIILGYFEVASVSEKRLFFNYGDFFPDEPLPKYPINCENNFSSPQIIAPLSCSTASFLVCTSRSLYEYVDQGVVAYWSTASTDDCEAGPYIVIPRGCGDCTQFGSNQVPEFWIE